LETRPAQLGELATKGVKSFSASLYHAKRGKSPFKKGEQNVLCFPISRGNLCRRKGVLELLKDEGFVKHKIFRFIYFFERFLIKSCGELENINS